MLLFLFCLHEYTLSHVSENVLSLKNFMLSWDFVCLFTSQELHNIYHQSVTTDAR